MNYKATLSYILEQLPMYQRIGKTAYRSGLENTIRLDHYFNHPHTHFKTIHVAGTNGKGSVSHMLASVLQEAGYNTGLYTSPHLVDFRERIKVNGKMISRNFVSAFINSHKGYFETFDPSFFEISVFMAFEYFKEKKVDIAVIEVGLGGRLDATNIISPLFSVITNIGRDHTEILGETPEKIAAEKAGIIKKNTLVIIGESQPETLPVFMDFSMRLEAPLYVADKIYSVQNCADTFGKYQIFDIIRDGMIRFAKLKCGLLGHYQRKNILTVLAAIETQNPASLRITDKNIYDGIKNVVPNTGLSGRWQVTGKNPLVICDTAHNADGIKAVLQQVNETPCEQLHLIIGFVNDKDIHEILKFMPEHASYSFVRLSVPRSMDESVLASAAQTYGLKGKVFDNISNAFDDVKKSAGRDDLILITGSNFLVADFLNLKA